MEQQPNSRLGRVAALAAIAVAVPVAVTACGVASGQDAPVSGHVTGTFIREGGPEAPGGQEPPVVRLRGLIEFTGSGRKLVKVHVSKHGTFAVSLAPGKYSVSGRTPSILEADGNGRPGREVPCSQPLSVTVTAGHTAKITVTCIVP